MLRISDQVQPNKCFVGLARRSFEQASQVYHCGSWANCVIAECIGYIVNTCFRWLLRCTRRRRGRGQPRARRSPPSPSSATCPATMTSPLSSSIVAFATQMFTLPTTIWVSIIGHYLHPYLEVLHRDITV